MKRPCLLALSVLCFRAFVPLLGPARPARAVHHVALQQQRGTVAVSAGKTQGRTYQVGDEVLTYYGEDCMWYPGRILSIDDTGSYLVKWDVPEDGIEEIRVTAEHMRCTLIPVRELQIGQQFSGVVYSVNQIGAFIDIGAEEHGLLPSSPEDVLEEGQSVKVWISSKKDRHVRLTRHKHLVGTDFSPFLDLSPDEWVSGVVKSIASFNGAFVTVSVGGVSADGFLHVSELSTSYVSSVRQVLSEGQEVRVRVLSVDIETGRMIVSMKATLKAEPETTGTQSRFGALADISSDQWLQGKVVRVIGVGAFVAVNPATAPEFAEKGAVEGLLHKSQIHDSARLRNGDLIKVRIEALDVKKEKLKLSMKPSGIVAVANDWYSGVVSSINRGGAVVAVVLKDGDYETGFLPLSKMPRDLDPRSLLVGQELKVKLVSFQSGKITLSMLDGSFQPRSSGLPRPNLSVFDSVPSDKWLLGFVADFGPPGIFVTLQLDGIKADALLRRTKVVRELKVGEPVRVRIIKVINLDNDSQKRMEVSMLPPRQRRVGKGWSKQS